jgi:lipoprotein-releasing system permease protein
MWVDGYQAREACRVAHRETFEVWLLGRCVIVRGVIAQANPDFMTPFSIFVGLRYTQARRRSGFVSFIAGISMAGITLGVATIIIVLSVMNGFQNEMKTRVLSMVSHAVVRGYDGALTDWPTAIKQAQTMPEVVGAAPFIETEALLQASETSGAFVRGVLPEMDGRVSEIGNKLKVGTLGALKPGAFNIILGIELAAKLGVGVDDKVTVFAPSVSVSPAGAIPSSKRFTVVGLLEVGMYEYDSALAVMHMNDAQKLFRLRDAVSGVQLKLKDMDQSLSVARRLAIELGGGFSIEDWTRRHGNLFKAIRTEKVMMFLILCLILTVAAFNLISTLVVTVTQKQADIAILRTMGASPATIMRIFMVQGSLIGWIGTAIGVVAGVVIALNVGRIVPLIERVLGFEAMPADVYYINKLPSEVIWSDVATVALVSVLFALLATIYPAWRAARTKPAQALRYE